MDQGRRTKKYRSWRRPRLSSLDIPKKLSQIFLYTCDHRDLSVGSTASHPTIIFHKWKIFYHFLICLLQIYVFSIIRFYLTIVKLLLLLTFKYNALNSHKLISQMIVCFFCLGQTSIVFLI